jgi:hypothetical protein
MEKNEIKKALYKQNQMAELIYIRKGTAYYDCVIRVSEEPIIEVKTIFFEIPVVDMGDADFLPTMEGKLLIRWIV